MAALCRDCSLLSEAPVNDRCAACGSPRLVVHSELDALAIAHVDCDAFYAAIEKRDAPALADKPVIVGHAGGRGVVTTACYVARRYGPRSAMPMFRALQLCPEAVVIPPNMPKYRQVSRQVQEILRSVTPLVEPVSLDEAYLDLRDGVRLDPRPPAVVLADAARRIERELAITVSIGLSYNMFLAKIASDLKKPRGYSVIGRAEARSFLAALPVRRISGVGTVTARRMAEAGIETVAQLQALSEGELVARYGRFGRRLAALVRGEDDRRVTPDRPAKSISTETTFAHDLTAPGALQAALRPLCERVGQRLQRADAAGSTIVLKLKTSDFRIHTCSRRLRYPTQRAEIIFEHAAALLAREADGRRFRLIGIGVADLCPASHADPPDLFASTVL